MNIELFIARRISGSAGRTFSKAITTIAIIGIALGLSVMIASFAIVTGFKKEIKDKITGFAGDLQIIKYDLNTSLENSAFHLSGQQIEEIQQDPNVMAVQAYATKSGIISVNNEIEGVILKGLGENYDLSFLKKNLKTGNIPNFNVDTIVSELLISQYTARKLELNVGDYVKVYFVQEPLRVRRLKIAGLFDTAIEDLDKLYAIGDIKLIRRLNDWPPDEVGAYEVLLKNSKDLNIDLREKIDNLTNRTISYPISEIYPAIFDWLSLLDINAEVILILMLVVAGINMISALLILILERTNMIGILKALGASDFSMRKIFLYNASYLIIKGIVAGNIIGLGFCWMQQRFKWIKLDQKSYYMSFVPIDLSIQTILLLNACTFITCVLMLLIPSMLISGISPLKAIRFK